MKIFDAHIHIFPNEIAAPAIQKLSEVSHLTPTFDGTRQGALSYLREQQIAAGLNCPIATRPKQVESILNSAVEQKWPLISLGSIHPDTPNKREILKKIKALGLPGIKMHPEYQQFVLEEERVQEIWQVCQELDLPILFHTGEDIAFEPPCKCPPQSLKWLITQYPKLTVIAAHFGGWQMWNEIDTLIGEKIYLDLALVFDDWDKQKVAAVIKKHGVDKILFASDSPWGSAKRNFEILQTLGFSEEEMNKICWKNAAKIFRLEKFCQ